MSPPTRSTDCEISVADRVVGALEQQVFEEVADPGQRAGSSRAPTPTQAPIDAVRVESIGSTATVSPDAR